MKTNGPGKYDDLATYVRNKVHARGVVVLIFGGDQGEGFSAQLPADLLITLPAILRDVATQVERQATES